MTRRKDPNDWTATDAIAWRERMKCTQAEAAGLLAATPNTIANRERGRRRLAPDVALLMRYVERFGPLD